jgi:hypothetical protein
MIGHRINGRAFSLKSILPKAALPAGACAVAFLTGCLDMNAPQSTPPQESELTVSLATTTTRQAENATTISGAKVMSSNAGFQGTGYVDYQNASNDFVEWSLGTLAAGSYTVTFRYANGSTSGRPLKLADGTGAIYKSSFSFPPTGSWTTWKTVSFTQTFTAGSHKLRATATGQSGPNLDYLQTNGPGTTTTQRKANLTWFTSYPAPGSEECIVDNGCAYEGLFAALDGKQSLDWVKSHNIIAVHERDFSKYKLHNFHITQGTHVIDAKVYDECADSDCDGCCTKNASSTGFLIDMETFTTKRFGANDGIVNWICTDCN